MLGVVIIYSGEPSCHSPERSLRLSEASRESRVLITKHQINKFQTIINDQKPNNAKLNDE